MKEFKLVLASILVAELVIITGIVIGGMIYMLGGV